MKPAGCSRLVAANYGGRCNNHRVGQGRASGRRFTFPKLKQRGGPALASLAGPTLQTRLPTHLSTASLILGIDGGGTKTVAWLAPLDDATNTIVLGRGQSGPGNPRAAGFDVAQANIAAAIDAAF